MKYLLQFLYCTENLDMYLCYTEFCAVAKHLIIIFWYIFMLMYMGKLVVFPYLEQT